MSGGLLHPIAASSVNMAALVIARPVRGICSMGVPPVGEDASEQALQGAAKPKLSAPGERQKHGQQSTGRSDGVRHAEGLLCVNTRDGTKKAP